jgi:hypothetical protein
MLRNKMIFRKVLKGNSVILSRSEITFSTVDATSKQSVLAVSHSAFSNIYPLSVLEVECVQ